MILVIDLFISAHEPYTRMIVVTLRGIAVIPFTVKLDKKPEMDVSVTCRITVDSHVRDACRIKKHLAA